MFAKLIESFNKKAKIFVTSIKRKYFYTLNQEVIYFIIFRCLNFKSILIIKVSTL